MLKNNVESKVVINILIVKIVLQTEISLSFN